jgi:DNA-binding transcriptional LysR family regulator
MTHAGAQFKRHVDAMLHELDDGLAAVNQLIDPETGKVAVAFQLSLGTWLLPDLVGSFRAEHPGVQFELRQVRDELISSALDDGRVDLEISTVRPRGHSVRWRGLLAEPLRLAVPRSHPLAGRSEVHLSEVSDEPFVTLRPTSLLRKLCEQLCAEAGFQPIVAFEGEDLPTVRGFVAAGLGVAIVPAVREGSPEMATGPLLYLQIGGSRAEREIGLSWSAERRLLPAAELFRRHVIDRTRRQLVPAVSGPASA